MSKTPEEYFQEQEFRSEPETQEDTFTEAEKAFLEKYLGLEEPDILEKIGIEAPVEPVPVPEFEPVPEPVPEPEPEPEVEAEPEPEQEISVEAGEDALEDVDEDAGEAAAEEAEALPQREEEDLEPGLRNQDSLQLVSFLVRHQEYTLPIMAVQEVLRAVKPTQVPEAPPFMAGLANLRGRVTPLVRLDILLGIEHGKTRLREEADAADDGEDRFIVVCRKQGLQVGLLVRQVTTMYRVEQSRIDWNIESRLGGPQDQLVTALMRKEDDSLVGILSIDKLIERILKR